jgi:glycosyltransferase involved in cell wall biosynthesis
VAATVPLISVITPTLNQGGTIEETIQSVASQDYPNFEHIVVDGGSTDRTLEILGKYPQLRWVSEPDRGQSDAINKGLRMSAGDILAYLNSDDVYRPGAFQAVADAFDAHPQNGVVVGDCHMIDARSEIQGLFRARVRRREDLLRYWEWGTGFCIPQPAVFVRRELFGRAGGFREHLHLAMDYDMWLRLSAYTGFTVVSKTLAAFRVAPDTKTRRQRYAMTLEGYLVSRNYTHLVPWRERFALGVEAHRQIAGHLLTLAEEELADRTLDRPASRILLRAIGLWPLLCGSPRVWRALGRSLLRSPAG